jgi:hypothetical protein
MIMLAYRPLCGVWQKARLADLAVVLTLLGASLWILLAAPVADGFSWSDAPCHALIGAFIMDLV